MAAPPPGCPMHAPPVSKSGGGVSDFLSGLARTVKTAATAVVSSRSGKLAIGVAAASFAGAVLLNAGMSAFKNDRKKKHDERRALRLVSSKFTERAKEICELIAGLPWCTFSQKDVQRLHYHFREKLAAYDRDPEVGELSRRDFRDVLATLGLSDPIVAESWLRTWDRNRDGSVDFLEMLEGLSAMQGDPRERLGRFFHVFDLDGDGFIDRGELEHVLGAFYAGEEKEVIKGWAARFLAVADTPSFGPRGGGPINAIGPGSPRRHHAPRDHHVSFQEFLNLASHEEDLPDLSITTEFTKKFLAHFGVGHKGIVKPSPFSPRAGGKK